MKKIFPLQRLRKRPKVEWFRMVFFFRSRALYGQDTMNTEWTSTQVPSFYYNTCTFSREKVSNLATGGKRELGQGCCLASTLALPRMRNVACHQRMRPEREYCFTCDRPVPYDRDAGAAARRREADRGILRRLNAKEEQKKLRQERDQLRVAKAVLERRYVVLEGLYERMRAGSISPNLVTAQPVQVTKLIQREARRLTLAFARVTFRGGVPHATRGGYALCFPLLPANHVLYAESVLAVQAEGFCDFWTYVVNSWKTNTIRRSHLDIKGLGEVGVNLAVTLGNSNRPVRLSVTLPPCPV
jgi:hypothetical protein